MSLMEITESQLLAKLRSILRSILKKDPGARTIGIYSNGTWRGGNTLTIDTRKLNVVHCASPLAFREQLVAASDHEEITVLLTPLPQDILGQDVLARLCRQQFFTIDNWRIVKDLLNVETIDSRLIKHSWMAETLLNAQPRGGYPPVPGRALTSEFAWQLLLKAYLGIDQPQVDAIELVRWAKEAERVDTYLRAPAEFRASLPEWITQSTGEVGRVLLEALEQGHGHDLIPLGLVCQVLFKTNASTMATAAARLEERFLGGKSLQSKAGQQWGAAADTVVEALLVKRAEYQTIQSFLQRAEVILEEIKAQEFIVASPFLPKGFEQRLEKVAQGILKSITPNPDKKSLDALEESIQQALEHRLSRLNPNRAEKIRMAARLVRWLVDPTRTRHAESFHAAVVDYFNNSGFVDWARTCIWDGDNNTTLAQAFAKLAVQVDEQRELENHRFGGLIQEWSLQAVPSSATMWIEELLDQVVVPLAKTRPTLLLVLDGMSVAVFRELIQEFYLQGWVELGQGDDGARRPVIAALPTITEISRASLLCGQLTSGTSATEKEAFRKHEGLRSTGRSNFPPLLYHKGELTVPGSRGLAPGARAEIAGTDRRVIGVVLNTVDDHLATGEQFRATWNTETIIPLGQILDAAREANRILVLTSDHGHILERDLEFRPQTNSKERYRPASGVPASDEVLLQGQRIRPLGEKIIAPWSEKIRYAPKKYGYHGGVSPQEVVVPLAVLQSGNQDAPQGWIETASPWPNWWDRLEPEDRDTWRPSKRSKPIKRSESIAGQPSRLPGLKTDTDSILDSVPEPFQQGGWIEALLNSPLFLEQKLLAARTAPEDAKVRQFLELLERRGGKMTRTAMIKTLEIPPMRFPGLLASLRRLLNVEGYPILGVDDKTDRVELDKKLLFTQFEIKD